MLCEAWKFQSGSTPRYKITRTKAEADALPSGEWVSCGSFEAVDLVEAQAKLAGIVENSSLERLEEERGRLLSVLLLRGSVLRAKAILARQQVLDELNKKSPKSNFKGDMTANYRTYMTANHRTYHHY
jgi:hypothetical protein